MTTTPVSTPIRVLLVDDNVLAARALDRWLSASGRVSFVGWAGDDAAAIAKVVSEAPDVVLLDLEMPGVDTVGLIPRMNIAAPRARIVMLSGHVGRADISRAFDGGAAGYIAKDEPTAVISDLICRAADGAFVLSPLAQRSFLAKP